METTIRKNLFPAFAVLLLLPFVASLGPIGDKRTMD
jgi:hypothetical protein